MVKKQVFKRIALTLLAVSCLTLSLTTKVYGEETTSRSQTELDKVNQISTIKDMDKDTVKTYLLGLIAIEEPTETDEQALSVAFKTVLNPDTPKSLLNLEGITLYSDDDIGEFNNFSEKINQSAYSPTVKEQIIDEINNTVEKSHIEEDSFTKNLVLTLFGLVLVAIIIGYLWARFG